MNDISHGNEAQAGCEAETRRATGTGHAAVIGSAAVAGPAAGAGSLAGTAGRAVAQRAEWSADHAADPAICQPADQAIRLAETAATVLPGALPSAGRALIVAHGQPSDPMPAEAALAVLAAAVAARLPGWRVGSATLAAPGALEAAVAGLAAAPGEPPLRIYPMFMADGWFTQVNLPRRLREGGVSVRRHRQEAEAGPGAAAPQAEILAPFGLDRGILPLALASLDTALLEEGVTPSGASLLVAAHGSFKSPAPAAVARRLARAVIAQRGFAELRTGFIDQAPQISQQARDLPGRAFCLPFFAASGGHVEEDLPAALELAGFEGRVLAPLGLAPGAAALVTAALLRA